MSKAIDLIIEFSLRAVWHVIQKLYTASIALDRLDGREILSATMETGFLSDTRSSCVLFDTVGLDITGTQK